MSIRTQARPGQITRVIRLATPRSDAGSQGVHLVREALGAGGEATQLGVFGLAIGEGGRAEDSDDLAATVLRRSVSDVSWASSCLKRASPGVLLPAAAVATFRLSRPN